jgi:transposase
MKINTTAIQTNQSVAILAFDVSKNLLNMTTAIGGQRTDHEFSNRTPEIEKQLTAWKQRAQMAGFSQVLVVCEPTGCYHMTLLATAHRLGLKTAWVSGEAVYKMRAIETNDSGKTDLKDPHVIYTLASMGKTLICRHYDESYALLRQWHALYEQADIEAVRAKCLLATQLKVLFPDYDFQKDFLYTRSGAALVDHYGANPQRIIKAGQKRFARKMKQAVPRIRQSTLDRLYAQAQSSARNQSSSRLVEIQQWRFLQLWEDLQRHQSRKQEARQQMESLYDELCQFDPSLPHEQKDVISSFYLARIVAETGPVNDFDTLRKFMRYAGLNLREKQSGTYRGKDRLSKKGRCLLRKVLSQAVLPLVKKEGLYGPYYHGKKAQGMSGTKALTAVMRKFLKLFYGWYKSGGHFDRNRIFNCESQYQKAA